ncbi:relaxase domain-containing protein [Phycicoccus sp. MAQZ13P-2]|uniref:MobF family relaxase n=1 Tax=Phycicoccus mangrovi TaxID=2840470 RepID=UPI001C000B9F|nr:MobF family relaxase [Phycicoccus mangrovi]MBT9254585.1 relaxase domain-containing protein [Phycicoccus mangrovi]MBT9273210.1 relaxase domain-containing protein [Phycicoccus mangrovi]
MTLHKLSAGSGYEYLTRQVAAHDATELGRGGLEGYYSEKGEAPGRWVGSGLVGVDGLEAGDVVTAEQMRHLFGSGSHPVTGVALGARYRVQGTDGYAGFNREVARRVAERGSTGPGDPDPTVSAAAVRSEVARELFFRERGRAPRDERELASAVVRYSRPQRVTVAGFDLTFSPVKSVSALWAVAPPEVARAIERAHVAAVADALAYIEREVLFTREGKDGARQVETRGLVAAAFTHRDSRAGDPDLHTHVAVANKVQTREGKWLSVYGRVLHQHVVAVSETYNTALERRLVTDLGVRFADRTEVTGERHPVREIDGVDPRLCQRWSRRRTDITARQRDLSSEFRRAHGRPPTPVEAIALAQRANLETREAKHEPRSLAEQRAAWRVQAVETLGPPAGVERMVAAALQPNRTTQPGLSAVWVRAAAGRVVAEVESRRATWQTWHLTAEAQRQVRDLDIAPGDIAEVVAHVVQVAAAELSVNLTPERDPIMDPAVLRRSDGTSVYRHTGSNLFTSPRILAAERRLTTAAGRADGVAVDLQDARFAVLEASLRGVALNRGQSDLVVSLAASARRVQLVLAPAGSGKTTALAVLADLWRGQVGPVVGMAPSAAAASVLGDATGIPADTLAKVVHDLDRGGGSPVADTIGLGALVLVDEAGMADTLTLDRVVAHALGRGASVRLVGDDQQLAAVGAGGVLRDIAATHGAIRLDEVVRFRDPVEAHATLALREGDASALGFYLDRGRVHVGDLAGSIDAAFEAWRSDRAAGRDCLMLAPSRDLVAALNDRARAARLDGQAPGVEIVLADGSRASAGDVVITRRNDRRLETGGTDWVKNGDRWLVTHTGGGALTVRRTGSRARVVLPADYVASHVELGYATTVHTAQGVTADTVHGIVTGHETRQLLYTMLTRGRLENHVHVPAPGDVDPHLPPVTDTTSPATATETLEAILSRDGAALSATSTQAHANSPAVQLRDAATRYDDALLAGAETILGDAWFRRLQESADRLVPGLTEAAAWPGLRAHLALTEADGHDATTALRVAAGRAGLDDVVDPAAVLLSRLEQPCPAGPLPWLPAIPRRLTDDPAWGPYLQARSTRVATLATAVQQQGPPAAAAWVASLPEHSGPDLLADLTLWRAGRGVDDADRRPTGPTPVGGGAARRHAAHLDQRIRAAYPDPVRYWEHVVVQHVGRRDGFTNQLAERLDRISRDGTDVPARLAEAMTAGPLPDDHPSATLWFRILDPDPASTPATPQPERSPAPRPEDQQRITAPAPRRSIGR